MVPCFFILLILFVSPSLFPAQLIAPNLVAPTTAEILRGEKKYDEKLDVLTRKPLPGGSTEFFAVQRLGPKLGIYYLGEDHANGYASQEGDLNTFIRFTQILRSIDEDESNPDRIHVLLEYCPPCSYDPADLLLPGHYGLSTRKCYKEEEGEIRVAGHLLLGLIPLHERRPFKKVVIEDVEIRRSCTGVVIIVGCIGSSCDYRKMILNREFREDFKEITGHDLLSFTFGDIIIDYERLVELCKRYQELWDDSAIKERIQHDLDQAEKYFSPIRRLINENVKYCGIDGWKIRPTTKVFEHCVVRMLKHSEPFRGLADKIVDAFSYFLDIHILHKVLMIRKEGTSNKIVLISGASHTRRVYVHLALAEDRQEIAGLHSDEQFTQDHLLSLEESLEEIEAKNSFWYSISQLFNSIGKLLTLTILPFYTNSK